LKLTEGGNRKKTVHLLQGSLSFRTMPQAIRVKDLTSAIAFAKMTGLPCLESVTEEKFNANVYRQRAQEVLEERGEILPGIEVLPERFMFRLTPNDSAVPSGLFSIPMVEKRLGYATLSQHFARFRRRFLLFGGFTAAL
jgi:hypothetical protein